MALLIEVRQVGYMGAAQVSCRRQNDRLNWRMAPCGRGKTKKGNYFTFEAGMLLKNKGQL
jgi:hypothetical protein